MKKTILITGTSSGIGRTTAKYFQEKGWNVIATIRNNPEEDEALSALDNVLVTKLDVRDSQSMANTVTKGIETFGKIDVLLNNAGYGAFGILEATPEAAIRKQFDVNVIGTLMMTKAVLPHMRYNKNGIIINLSSMAGKATFPMGSLYHGSKFAIEGLTESLRYEFEPVGIKVKLIEPGLMATNFGTSSAAININPELTEYQNITDKVLSTFGSMNDVASDPILVTETIYKAATDGTNQLRYPIGTDAEGILAARKSMEDNEFSEFVKQQYSLS
ncbi:MAG: SDR family oxidoreductase [Flavobacteriaceae bacterium]